jgi:outer membrane protein OmpA-like peptidoglycan-associated protein
MLRYALHIGVLGLFSQQAHAQDLERFRTGAGLHDAAGGLQLLHPDIGGEGAIWGSIFLSNGEYFDAADPEIRRMSMLRGTGGMTVSPAVRLELDLPLYPAAIGTDSRLATGDIRFGSTFALLDPDEASLGLALAPWLGLPTGMSARQTTYGGMSGGLVLALGGGDRTRWRTNFAYRTEANAQVHAADIGLGLEQRMGHGFELGGEILGSIQANPTELIAPIQGHLYGALHRSERQRITLAIGGGLVGAERSPAWRIAMGFSWRRPGTTDDEDGDGIFNLGDACPNTPEDIDGTRDTDGCPDPDDDADRIPDTVDSCSLEPEDVDGFEDTDGCPDPDNDADGILDGADDCPMEHGPITAHGCPDSDEDGLANNVDECVLEPGDPVSFGCPDRDADGVPDYRDGCPDEQTSLLLDPKRSDGCPALAFVSPDAIELTRIVQFDFAHSLVKGESHEMLMTVVRIMKEHPDIRKVQITGHADEVGGSEYNLGLSIRRAAAVKRFLVRNGIESHRLVVHGSGEALPMDTNRTESGRWQNRRVEIIILEVGN